MSRQRFIYPEFFESSDVGALPLPCRLLFIGLFTLADDHGRGRASPARLRGAVFPYDLDITDQDVHSWLGRIRLQNPEDPMVRTYTIRGARFYWLPKWVDYQTPKHVKASRLPEFDPEREDPLQGLAVLDPDRTGPGHIHIQTESAPGAVPDSTVLDGIVEDGTVTPTGPKPVRTGTPGATSKALVRLYVDRCGTSPPSDATFRSAQKLVETGLIDQVQAAIHNYGRFLETDPPPKSRRIKPHNWFGANGRWKEYTDTEELERPAGWDDGKVSAVMPGDEPPEGEDPEQTWRWERQGVVAGLISAACVRGGVVLDRHVAVNLAYLALEADDLTAEDPKVKPGAGWKPMPLLQAIIDRIVGDQLGPPGTSPETAGQATQET